MANNYFRGAAANNGKKYRINWQIRVPEVDLIDEAGQRLGIVNTKQALEMAESKGFDLVEVSPLSQPPVCKILDYGKFQYQQKRTQSKNKPLETKGLRLSFKIGQHDLLVKKKQAIKFLDKGHKVLIELKLRGREKAFRDQAKEIIKNFLIDLGPQYKSDKGLEAQGPTISILIYKSK